MLAVPEGYFSQDATYILTVYVGVYSGSVSYYIHSGILFAKYSDLPSDICSGVVSGMYSGICLAYYLAFNLANVLPFYLTYILAFYLAFTVF